jgi:DNA repair protein RadC
MLEAKTEDAAPYGSPDIIQQALDLLASRLRKPGAVLSSPQAVKDFCVLKYAAMEREVFSVILLTSQHAVLHVQEMFYGTLTQTSVYPREVVKAVLAENAAAVILVHNHPSGMAEPSRADEYLTSELKRALALVDVRVLDHIVVGGMSTVSFAERGLI